MHDLLEGAIAYEVKALLIHCIEQDYFTISELNGQIISFDFGYSESLNKPNRINDSVVRRQGGNIFINLHHRGGFSKGCYHFLWGTKCLWRIGIGNVTPYS